MANRNLESCMLQRETIVKRDNKIKSMRIIEETILKENLTHTVLEIIFCLGEELKINMNPLILGVMKSCK